MKSPAPHQDLENILSVVRKFEGCEYGRTEFTHVLHLTVAAWYLWTSTPEEALRRMRASLLRFTKHHDVSGYHETITRFWMFVVGAHIVKGCDGQTFLVQVNDLLDHFPDKNTLFVHYTRELVMSDQARATWSEPDLKPIGAHNSTICE